MLAGPESLVAHSRISCTSLRIFQSPFATLFVHYMDQTNQSTSNTQHEKPHPVSSYGLHGHPYEGNEIFFDQHHKSPRILLHLRFLNTKTNDQNKINLLIAVKENIPGPNRRSIICTCPLPRSTQSIEQVCGPPVSPRPNTFFPTWKRSTFDIQTFRTMCPCCVLWGPSCPSGRVQKKSQSGHLLSH